MGSQRGIIIQRFTEQRYYYNIEKQWVHKNNGFTEQRYYNIEKQWVHRIEYRYYNNGFTRIEVENQWVHRIVVLSDINGFTENINRGIIIQKHNGFTEQGSQNRGIIIQKTEQRYYNIENQMGSQHRVIIREYRYYNI